MQNIKKKRGRPPGASGATSLTGKIFEAMQVGDSVTFTRLADLIDANDASNFTHSTGSYATRRVPGGSFKYETFYAITSQRRVITGVILTRES